jgi:hypothetical protein
VSREPVLRFGEKVLAVLEQGSFTATYKYALLLAIIDALLEGTAADGSPPQTIRTRELARKTVDLYWPQCRDFVSVRGTGLLRQNTSGQAEIVTAVTRFREGSSRHALTHTQAAQERPEEYELLLDRVEYKLVQMPIPRLQRFGTAEERFIYDFSWDKRVGRRAALREPLAITMASGAAEALVQLAGLLRPLIQRQWAAMVASVNRTLVEDSQLEEFLFGIDRTSLARVRSDLSDMQDGRCFYCAHVVKGTPHVDHFVPWSRHPDNNICNLVVADSSCNSRKRDFLAAPGHLERWLDRMADAQTSHVLSSIAARRLWEHEPRRSIGAARALYLRLSDDTPLWLTDSEFVNADLRIISGLLTQASMALLAAEGGPP